MSGFKVQGRNVDSALRLLDGARRLQEAGCFALVLEGIPAELAARTTESLMLPTIGIGAGPSCSGQVLVFHDILGLTEGHCAKSVRAYAEGFGSCRRRFRVGLPMSATAHSRHHKNAIRTIAELRCALARARKLVKRVGRLPTAAAPDMRRSSTVLQ